MTIEIVEKSGLRIHATKQNIDKKMGLPPPLDDRNQVIVVTGSMGSGKSTWVHSSLTCQKSDGRIFAGCFEKVIYCTPLECWESEENHPMKGHIKSRLFHTFDVKTLTSIIEIAEETKKSEGNTLLCIDDFGEELKNIETIKLLRKIIFKHRHFHITIILSALAMKLIPKTIRSLVDVYIIFRPKSQIDCEDYVTEIFALKNKEFQSIMDFVFDAPHNFLMYNARHHFFYKNFDKLSYTS
jgi:hypothetical protein